MKDKNRSIEGTLATIPASIKGYNVFKDLARNISVDSQLPGRENGPADAYRHCVWTAMMAREYGAEAANNVGDLHA